MNGATLRAVDFANADGSAIDGLVPVRKPPAGLSADETAVVQQAATFSEITYVYFRRFNDGRSSQPAAYVVDNYNERLTSEQLAKLHNDLWLHGRTPLVYVAWPTRIDVLSCARGPDFWKADELAYHPAAHLAVASEIDSDLKQLRRFSANRLRCR